MTKVAFLDVDGTLTHGKSSWEKVHHHFGVQRDMKEHSKRYFAGELTYEEWAKLDVSLWKGHSIQDLDIALNPPDLIEGAAQGVKKIKDAGFYVVLLSGGIDVMVNEVARIVGADEAHANVIGHTNGILDGTVGVTVGIKSRVINQLQATRGYDLSQSVAVGDNFNDIDMFKLVGKSVAVNPKSEELTEVADSVIRTDNFVEVADHLLHLVG